jgi:hypothetical protein
MPLAQSVSSTGMANVGEYQTGSWPPSMTPLFGLCVSTDTLPSVIMANLLRSVVKANRSDAAREMMTCSTPLRNTPDQGYLCVANVTQPCCAVGRARALRSGRPGVAGWHGSLAPQPVPGPALLSRLHAGR